MEPCVAGFSQNITKDVYFNNPAITYCRHHLLLEKDPWVMKYVLQDLIQTAAQQSGQSVSSIQGGNEIDKGQAC